MLLNLQLQKKSTLEKQIMLARLKLTLEKNLKKHCLCRDNLSINLFKYFLASIKFSSLNNILYAKSVHLSFSKTVSRIPIISRYASKYEPASYKE